MEVSCGNNDIKLPLYYLVLFCVSLSEKANMLNINTCACVFDEFQTKFAIFKANNV